MKTGFICQFIIGFFKAKDNLYHDEQTEFFLQLMAFLIFPILNKVFLYNFLFYK